MATLANNSAEAAVTTATRMLPLVVDLDGTLTPADSLFESLVRLVKRKPWTLFLLALALLRGRARFKEWVATRQSLTPAQLPWREDLVDYLRAERRTGRRIVLATAANRTLAANATQQFEFFDAIIGSDGANNLKGTRKLAAIREQIGEQFVYAGDSRADLPIWQASSGAILVNASQAVRAVVQGHVAIERDFRGPRRNWRTWRRALRVHQWLKNALLGVPLLTAFSFLEVDKLVKLALAFGAFSLVASATYLVNDLWDLDSDRVHPRKRLRPLASGELPVANAVVAAFALLTCGFATAAIVSGGFAAMLLLYLVMTSAYSWMLKEYVLIDVIMLALLYTLRILAGGIAIGVIVSSWLLAFSVFMFLSLALVKRCSELMTLSDKLGTDGSARGRDYRVGDLRILWPLGVSAAMAAVVVFGLFLNAPETQQRYATPQLLWLVALGLVYWLARLWVKTSRGEMHDDPVVYAVRDRGSRFVFVAIIATLLLAYFFRLPRL
jgi:4-hydroxybenzoate polyprenyltransferase/phosphoserine phosphatase